MNKRIFPILALLGSLSHSGNAAVILASDDFSEANSTVLHNKAADVGGNWDVTVNNTVTIQGNAFDTDQAPGVQAFLGFTRSLAAGETLRFEFTTVATAGTMFEAGGLFAGFNIYTGSTNRIFVGDPGGTPVDNSPQNWSASGAALLTPGTVIQTNINDESVTGIFSYDFDTGASSLTIDNGSSSNTINLLYTSGLALDRIRIASGTGASEINVDRFEIIAVPEPSAALLGSLGAMLLLRRRI